MIDTAHKIQFDSENCAGCMLCYKACFVDVIRWDAEKKRPEFKYADDCEHCFCCQAVCPRGCIEIIPDYGSERLLQSFERYR